MAMKEIAYNWNTETLITASGLNFKLQNFNFQFFLVVSSIFPKFNILLQAFPKMCLILVLYEQNYNVFSSS